MVQGILYGTVVNRIRGGRTIDRALGPTSGPVGKRHAEARKLFDRLLSRCNDVGLLAEELDALTGRMLGNFPQAYSHAGLILRAQLEPAKRSGSGTRTLSFAP